MATTAWADDGAGTGSAADESVPAQELALGTISAANVFTKAQYADGGAGLRNRGAAVFNVSGLTGSPKGAFLFWAVIVNGTAPTSVQSVKLMRLSPSVSSEVTVTGTLIGTGSTPCWGGTGILVYKGSVPLSVASENGAYKVRLNKGASGQTDGADPWSLPHVYPLFEGATLVIVGTGTATVGIFDKGFAGKTFDALSPLSYTLKLPATATGRTVNWDNIGADGQTGYAASTAASDVTGRYDLSALSAEKTYINSKQISGPGSPSNDGDWNGAIAGPLPTLWDTTGHVVTSAAPKGTTSLKVSFTFPTKTNYDCLTPVANVVALY